MGHHFNGDDCSIQNLVFVPIDTVDEQLSNCKAETAKEIGNILDEENVLPPTMGNELSRNRP